MTFSVKKQDLVPHPSNQIHPENRLGRRIQSGRPRHATRLNRARFLTFLGVALVKAGERGVADGETGVWSVEEAEVNGAVFNALVLHIVLESESEE